MRSCPRGFYFEWKSPTRRNGRDTAVDRPRTGDETVLFLWSGPPDTALRAAADDGTLTDPAVLEEHTRRMLADPKAEALVLGFGAQWLGLEELHKATPDTGTYPTFTEPLREAMAVEMQDHIRRALLGEDSMMLCSPPTRDGSHPCWQSTTDCP